MSKAEAHRHLQVAQQKLEAAQLLHEGGLFADAVGRAYYAMYHAAHAVLASHGLDVRTHRGLIFTVRERFTGPHAFDALLLQALVKTQRLRETGDYDALAEVTAADSEEAVASARRIVARAEDLVAK